MKACASRFKCAASLVVVVAIALPLVCVGVGLAEDGSSGTGGGQDLGIELRDARGAELAAMLERGDLRGAQTGIEQLMAQPDSGRSLSELNELRLAQSMILLRVGEAARARRLLLPLTRVATDDPLRFRARILLDILSAEADARQRPSPLASPERWQSAVEAAATRCIEQWRDHHERVRAAIEGGAPAVMEQRADERWQWVEQLAVVTLDRVALHRTAGLTGLESDLADEVRLVNVLIKRRQSLVTELAGRMSLRSDAQTRQRGYVPTDVVDRHNQIVAEMAALNAVGERLVSDYLRCIDLLQGSVKRRSEVKMNVSRLPEMRPAFGR